MLKKYQDFKTKINEEVGIRNITKIVQDHLDTGSNNFEIWFHQDLDGVTSALAMKKYLERYDLKLVDAHIIQYGGLEYAIKNKRPDSMAVLVDYAHFRTLFTIGTDHHSGQAGEVSGASHAKPTRSNVETISGEISNSDIFTAGDIKLIQTVDSADFLRQGITPEDIQNSIFSVKPTLSGEKNRFMMGFVVNRLLLVYKTKRISVKSLDGKRDHINKNLLECLVLDSTPSLVSMYLNLKHYMNSAVSLEWDRSKREHNVPKRLASPEEINANLQKYITSRKSSSDVNFDPEYKIVSQYGIGSVFEPGAYDRYVVFKNNPEAEFVCTIFPMGLIQVSCN
ncbi:MAG: DHH family phosphoesterase, partial [Methanobacterium sp.]